MKKRMTPLRAGFLFLLISLLFCGCSDGGTAPAAGSDQSDSVNVTLLQTEQYLLTVPDAITVQKGEDGTVALLLDGAKVGGVSVLPYPNAAELNQENPDLDAATDRLVQLVDPEGQSDHLLDCVPTEKGNQLLLSLVPEPNSGEPETLHCLLPQGDVLYDLFLQPEAVPDQYEDILMDSFSVKD